MGAERRSRRLVKSVDTNILVRALTRDDPEQAALAAQVLERGAFVSLTVLLETACVLKSNYRLSAAEVSAALNALLSLRSVVIHDERLVSWALERAASGAQIADMIHIVGSRDHEAFVTLDRGVARAAGTRTPVPIETLG